METSGLLDEIEVLVEDKLQVVSYKWLSRKFSVSSDAAKGLLQKFVDTRESSFQVVYTLAGWLKKSPTCYQIKLVSSAKVEETKQEFDGNCSVHVYSVQSCIPKDPASLRDTEHVQAEQLFKQPITVDNCLRDNRFCGIQSSFVKRNVDGASTSGGASYAAVKEEQVSVPSTSNFAKSIPEASGNGKLQQANTLQTTRKELNGAEVSSDKECILPSKSKISDPVKAVRRDRGSLANLWGRSSAKSKPATHAASNKDQSLSAAVSADAQICESEAMADDFSDDEPHGMNFQGSANREPNRKRKVVLDFSDDEFENSISIVSPESVKGVLIEQPESIGLSNCQTVKEEKPAKRMSINIASPEAVKAQSGDDLVAEKLALSEQPHSKPENEEKAAKRPSNNCCSLGKTSKESHLDGPREDVTGNTPSIGNSTSPKKRKILKTRIDERGREVTEVVIEGNEPEGSNRQESVYKGTGNNLMKNIRETAPTKPQAIGKAAPNPSSKAGNKKGGIKDPKQGNILSFFKRS